MKEGTIRVPVNGGFLVAGKNADDDYDGIYIVTTECRKSELKRKIHIYSYLDVYSDDYTSKSTIDIDKIYDALG